MHYQESLRAAFLIWLILALSACFGTNNYSPADIPAVYSIRNAPRPVPVPLFKPSLVLAQAKARGAAGGKHRIVKGDTLFGLSRRYGFPVRDFVTVNRLAAPYTLHVNDRLILPRPKRHIVQRGDTGYSISRSYGVSVSDLMRINNIKPPYRLSVGQSLALPGGARKNQSRRADVLPSKSEPKAVSGKVLRPPPRTSSRFSWPLRGRVLSRFGPKAGGIHNDGINIAADRGASIKAAEAGVVVYASNILEGYGNMILVRHEGGWITAYAHAETLLVKEGDQITRGKKIATVGSSGGLPNSQLHFEIRRGRQAVDPLRYLAE